MQQRVLIATALICDPELLILDEPTTALDVTVEAQILDLLDRLRKQRQLGMIYITHNLGVVSRIADRVCVLYAGHVFEIGDKSAILGDPMHPYTKGLLASLPHLAVTDRAARLSAIPGEFPDLTKPVQGCVHLPPGALLSRSGAGPSARRSSRRPIGAACAAGRHQPWRTRPGPAPKRRGPRETARWSPRQLPSRAPKA